MHTAAVLRGELMLESSSTECEPMTEGSTTRDSGPGGPDRDFYPLRPQLQTDTNLRPSAIGSCANICLRVEWGNRPSPRFMRGW
jgi:hypothetical protein